MSTPDQKITGLLVSLGETLNLTLRLEVEDVATWHRRRHPSESVGHYSPLWVITKVTQSHKFYTVADSVMLFFCFSSRMNAKKKLH